MLTYFEKKYPNSYKYFVIEKKVAECAPLYFNQPLIDKIHITGQWGGFSDSDIRLAKSCDAHATFENIKHDTPDWYNYRCQVEETARLGGIYDLKEVLTEEEMMPKLERWFDVGYQNFEEGTYVGAHHQDNAYFNGSIAIWPFAMAVHAGRSPSVEWWKRLVDTLILEGYRVLQFGYSSDPILSENKDGFYKRFNDNSYFDQVRFALATNFSIGTDSGNMWVMGAYSHPAIHLITNFLPGHSKNVLALAPINKNATNLFVEDGVDNIKYNDIVSKIKEVVPL